MYSRLVPALALLGGLLIPAAAHAADGDLDPSFSGDGKQTIAYDLGDRDDDFAFDSVLLPDGKIITAGSASTADMDTEFAVTRLEPDGDLDPTWAGDGRLIVEFDKGGGNDDTAVAVARQVDGKLVVAGSVETDNSALGVVRLEEDGSLDPTFGTGGKALIEIGTVGSKSNGPGLGAMAIRSTGEIVIGVTVETAANGQDLGVVQLDEKGQLDPDFGTGGEVTIGFDIGPSANLQDDRLNGLGLLEDGSVVLAGQAETEDPSGGKFRQAFVKLEPDGDLDTTFSADGKRTVGIGDVSVAGAVDADPAGRLVATGTTNDAAGTDTDLTAVRLTPLGELDPTFAVGGKFTLDVGMLDQGTDVVVQSDGKPVVAGSLG